MAAPSPGAVLLSVRNAEVAYGGFNGNGHAFCAMLPRAIRAFTYTHHAIGNVVIELANGGYGYLPTPEQHELGGYETWLGTNRVEKEASRKIEATIQSLFQQIR